MSCRPLLLALWLGAVLLVGVALSFPCQAGPLSNKEPWLMPDPNKSTWLVIENRLVDASPVLPYKDAYMEVWQTTGQRQGEAFAERFGIESYDMKEKFPFYVFRLLNNGQVFQVNLELPNSTGVCLVDTQGKGVFRRQGSVFDDPKMPDWAVTASRQPKTFHPLPTFPCGTDQGRQQRDVFPQVPGKETTAQRYRMSDGSHIFILSFPNGTVWGYELIPVNKSKVSFWAPKWDRNFERKGGPPQPDFSSYGVAPK